MAKYHAFWPTGLIQLTHCYFTAIGYEDESVLTIEEKPLPLWKFLSIDFEHRDARGGNLHWAGQEYIRNRLREDYINKCDINSRYSMRAYAKHLGIDQSQLSKILSGKQDVSRDRLLMLVDHFPEIAGLVESLNSLNSPHENVYNKLEPSKFKMMAKWYYFAILEVIKLKGFRASTNWISRRLGISKIETVSALETLSEIGLINKNSKSINLKQKNNSWSNHKLTTEARQQLQKDYLDLAKNAIDEVPYKDRLASSLTVAISKKDLPELRECLRQFRRDFDQKTTSNEYDEVYQLCISFYPLTKKGK